MEITVRSTDKIVTINGVDCRVWEGETKGGIGIQCLIPRLSAMSDQSVDQFERELIETGGPSFDAVRTFPLRMVL